MTDHDPETLDFEGEQIFGIRTSAKGAIPGGEKMRRRERFAFVAVAKVARVDHLDVKNVPTRDQIADIEKATIIGVDYARDVIDEADEATTGQMRLLSIEGEIRRAGRHAAAAAENDENDEILPDDATAGWWAEVITRRLEQARTLDMDGDDYSAEESTADRAIAYFADVEDLLEAAAARTLQAVAWARRERWNMIEAKRETEQAAAVVQARLDAEAALASAASDETRDRAERRGAVDQPPREGIEVDRESGAVSVAGEGPYDPLDPPPIEGDTEDADEENAVDGSGEPLIPRDRQVELARLMASLESGAGATFTKWCESNGFPLTLSELTVGAAAQVEAKLRSLLDA